MNCFQIYLYFVLLIGLFSCQNIEHHLLENSKATSQYSYLNHGDSAKYVGKQTCMLCHQNIYNHFIQTGMGKSWKYATKQNSSAYFDHSYVYDKFNDFHYTAFLKNDSIYIKEYRFNKTDTIFMMVKKIDYIVGSGQHTNSHLYSINGYLYQAPMTFYTQKKIWDLPPGFEDGHNTRFFRKIGLECITCHNAYPDFVNGSENKYTFIPTGIDCERCHGPGSVHVNKIRRGDITDTSKYIDYSIVNPAKLPIDRQFDICMRCHLQGNAVLVNNANFFDFKPGMVLSQYIQVFLPRYSDSKDNFIMASHADRLKQSQCFVQSLKKASLQNTLKPYKNALTCVTCHNPHISVTQTKSEKFISACLNCHQLDGTNSKFCTLKEVVMVSQKKDWTKANCISCHMPVSGSKDIPHVTIHDHFIRVPDKQKNKSALSHQFLGLVCINDSHPSIETRAKAYIYQFEKFDPFPYYLDSAEKILNIKNQQDIQRYFHTYIHVLFLKQDIRKIDEIVQREGISKLLKQLSHKDLNNTDAWTSYRIGEAEYSLGKVKEAEMFFENAVQLAPYVLEFVNKLAVAQMYNQKILSAYKNWLWIIKENPMFIQAYSNLGFLKLQQNQLDSAYYYLSSGLKIHPDSEMLLSNLIAYYLRSSQFDKAKQTAYYLLKKHPENLSAKQVLNYLK